MFNEAILRAVAPCELGQARCIAHQAVQLLTRAARANLPAAADDSHSNLGWAAQHAAFLSQPIAAGSATIHVGVSFDPLRLMLETDGQVGAALSLDGQTYGDASSWLDGHLGRFGLQPSACGDLPYDLPDDVASLSTFDVAGRQRALATLAAWFAGAHETLTHFAATRSASITPGPSPVRCWPHHFDIATYVSLESGDAETARGIGVGLSPGDESYDQPYLYINPWPHLQANALPGLPPPGHWHTAGFVGAIATAEAMLDDDNLAELTAYVDQTFDIGRKLLFARD